MSIDLQELRRALKMLGVGARGATGPAGSIADAWPIGSIFIAVVSTNPSTLLGVGTWTAFGAGRVLVGLNASDTDFDTAEETGGAKTVAAAGSNATASDHTHSVTSNVTVGNHDLPQTAYITTSGVKIGTGTATAAAQDHDHVMQPLSDHAVTNNAVTSGAGGSHGHTFTGSATSVVQPYIVVYMWKRTA